MHDAHRHHVASRRVFGTPGAIDRGIRIIRARRLLSGRLFNRPLRDLKVSVGGFRTGGCNGRMCMVHVVPAEDASPGATRLSETLDASRRPRRLRYPTPCLCEIVDISKPQPMWRSLSALWAALVRIRCAALHVAIDQERVVVASFERSTLSTNTNRQA